MAVRNPTVWTPPSGRGYVNPSTLSNILTQSSKNLLTQSKVAIIINPDTYAPVHAAAWTLTTKGKASWNPASGSGVVVTVGNQDIITNNGKFITDNLGDLIVTNTTYNQSKKTTQWTASGN